MSNETILVIDDSKPVVRHLVEAVLPLHSYRTKYAYDGHTGLKLIRESRPDLIVLDFNLPEMTGLDVLQAMAHEAISIPVILMTGYGSELSAIEAFRLGAKDYLIKPFTTDEILEAIERALTEQRLQHNNEILADQVRRLKVSMSRQNEEMATLFRIGKAITSLTNVEKVLQRVLEAAINLTDAETSTIYLPKATNTELKVYKKVSVTNQQGQDSPLVVENQTISEVQAGKVLRTGQPLRQSKLSGKGILYAVDHRARAVLHVPLKLREQTIGVLNVNNVQSARSFSKRDEFLLTFLADYAAIALENARIFQATDHALAQGLDELNRLIDVTQAITSSLDLSEIIQLTIQQLHDSWQIEAASLWLLDESGKQLRVSENIGLPDEGLKEIVVPIGQGFVGRVAQTGEWFFTNDVAHHPHHFSEVDQQTNFQTRSLLCVPLKFHDQVLGALQLLNKQDGDFDENDVERAMAMATAVAIAITNSRLLVATADNSRFQDEFVTTVSHDMRAPLTAVATFANDLSHAGPLTPKQTSYVDHILKSTAHMTALVDDLLALAKLNALPSTEFLQPCDFNQIVQHTAQLFSSIAIACHITLETDLPPQPIFIQGNARQLERAISNLLDNAIKFSDAGQAVNITLITNEQHTLLTIKDCGIGITEQELAFVFDKLYQGHAGQQQGGTGLGLAIVKSIVAAHKGTVSVESSAADGTTFFMQLPCFQQTYD